MKEIEMELLGSPNHSQKPARWLETLAWKEPLEIQRKKEDLPKHS